MYCWYSRGQHHRVVPLGASSHRISIAIDGLLASYKATSDRAACHPGCLNYLRRTCKWPGDLSVIVSWSLQCFKLCRYNHSPRFTICNYESQCRGVDKLFIFQADNRARSYTTDINLTTSCTRKTVHNSHFDLLILNMCYEPTNCVPRVALVLQNVKNGLDPQIHRRFQALLALPNGLGIVEACFSEPPATQEIIK